MSVKKRDKIYQGLLTEITSLESMGTTSLTEPQLCPVVGQPLNSPQRGPCMVPTLDTDTQSFPLDNSAYLHLCKNIWLLEHVLNRIPGHLPAGCVASRHPKPSCPSTVPACPTALGMATFVSLSWGPRWRREVEFARQGQDQWGTWWGSGEGWRKEGSAQDLGSTPGAMAPQGIPDAPASPGHGCAVSSPGLRCTGWKAIRFPEKQRFSTALTCFAFTGVTRKES